MENEMMTENGATVSEEAVAAEIDVNVFSDDSAETEAVDPVPEEACDDAADLDAQIREAVENAVSARITEAVETAVARAVSEALAAEREAARRTEAEVAEAVRQTEERMIGHIRARGVRPTESGIVSGSGVRMHPAVDRLTRRDRERLARMAAEGETVRL